MRLIIPRLPFCTFLGCTTIPSFSQDSAAVPGDLGMDLHLRSDLDSAIAIYREALHLQPDFSDVCGYQRFARG
jgi:hypothetical protein